MRDDVGVEIFLGTREGDGKCVSVNGDPSGCGVGGVNGMGGAPGIIDILFSLRASVGLIVRAASPVACALLGRIDILFPDDGVVVRSK